MEIAHAHPAWARLHPVYFEIKPHQTLSAARQLVLVMDNTEKESSGDSSSVMASLASGVISSPLSWWIFIILSLYLMEKFELGTHSLPWNFYRRSKSKVEAPNHVRERPWWRNNGFSKHDVDEDCSAMSRHSNGVKCVHGLSRRISLQQFQEFAHSQLVPKFRMQCKNDNGKFAVLVFSHITSLQDAKDLVFRQITFNGKPLVDAAQTTYPEAYRLENYIAAQGTELEHPEVAIARQVPALLAGFGRAERCYLRNPVPAIGILYCWEMPCSKCTGLLIECLSGICRKRTILAYSKEGTKEGKINFQRLVDAEISVIKI